MSTDFKNSFTVAFSDKLQKRLNKTYCLPCKSAAALPCKILTVQLYAFMG